MAAGNDELAEISRRYEHDSRGSAKEKKMAKKRIGKLKRSAHKVSASTDDLLLAILEQGGDGTKTGRYLLTFKEGATSEGLRFLKSEGGFRVADARDFKNQAVNFEEVGGVTWGLAACKVPGSNFNGNGIKVAVLDTGFDLGHPEFAGRAFVPHTFVGQPVQDLHGHGTHTTGTACGPVTPPGLIQRYG